MWQKPLGYEHLKKASETLARGGEPLARGNALAELGIHVDMEEAVETIASSAASARKQSTLAAAKSSP